MKLKLKSAELKLKIVELKRKRVELKRKSVELGRKSGEAGRQKRERSAETTRKRSRSGSRSLRGALLPDEQLAGEFLRGEKGWDYTGNGWKVQGPDEGSKPMETSEVS